MKGIYIVFEGPDGSGTTSHSSHLANTLKEKGKNVFLTAEPTGGPIGLFIREQLSAKTGMPASALQLLFCADRAMHMERTVKPALERGDIVISDRSYLSTLAYGEALGLDIAWLESVNAPFIKPDLLIFAVTPLEVCLERLQGRVTRDILEEDSLQARVHKAYAAMSSRYAGSMAIDTSGAFEGTAGGIALEVTRFLDARAA